MTTAARGHSRNDLNTNVHSLVSRISNPIGDLVRVRGLVGHLLGECNQLSIHYLNLAILKIGNRPVGELPE